MPVDKVREIMRVAQEPVSLETPIGEEEDSHLGDFIPDDDAPAPADAASHTLLKEQLAEVLEPSPPGRKRFCACGSAWRTAAPRTLEEVGKEFNVTRERIRQIEAKALQKAAPSQPQSKSCATSWTDLAPALPPVSRQDRATDRMDSVDFEHRGPVKPEPRCFWTAAAARERA